MTITINKKLKLIQTWYISGKCRDKLNVWLGDFLATKLYFTLKIMENVSLIWLQILKVYKYVYLNYNDTLID